MKVYIVLYYYEYEGYSDPKFVSFSKEKAEDFVVKQHNQISRNKITSFEEYEKVSKIDYFEIFEKVAE